MPKTIRNQFNKNLTYEKLIEAHNKSKKGKGYRKEIILFNLKQEEYIMWLYEKLKTKIEAQLSSLKGVLSIGVDETNLKNLEERIALIVAALSNPDALSKEQIVAYNKELAETQQRIDNIKKSDFLKGLEENFAYLKKGAGTKEFFEGLSSDLGQISGSFGELSNALGGVNTEAGYTLDTIGQLVGVASDAAGAAASFASGDIIGGVTKTIKAISGIFSIGKKVKEMNAAS